MHLNGTDFGRTKNDQAVAESCARVQGSSAGEANVGAAEKNQGDRRSTAPSKNRSGVRNFIMRSLCFVGSSSAALRLSDLI